DRRCAGVSSRKIKIQGSSCIDLLRMESPAGRSVCAHPTLGGSAVAVWGASVVQLIVCKKIPVDKTTTRQSNCGGGIHSETLARPGIEELERPGVDINCVVCVVVEEKTQ